MFGHLRADAPGGKDVGKNSGLSEGWLPPESADRPRRPRLRLPAAGASRSLRRERPFPRPLRLHRPCGGPHPRRRSPRRHLLARRGRRGQRRDRRTRHRLSGSRPSHRPPVLQPPFYALPARWPSIAFAPRRLDGSAAGGFSGGARRHPQRDGGGASRRHEPGERASAAGPTRRRAVRSPLGPGARPNPAAPARRSHPHTHRRSARAPTRQSLSAQKGGFLGAGAAAAKACAG